MRKKATENDGEWWRIEAPHFTAGFHIGADGVIDRGADILRWTRGKRLADVQRYGSSRRWKIERLADAVKAATQ
jgi:hypothetical protein